MTYVYIHDLKDMNHSFQMAPSKLKSILWIMSYCSWKLGQYFSNSVQQKLALLMCQQKYDISIRLPPYDTLFTSKCTCESGASLCIHLRAVEAIPDDRDVSEGNLAESEKPLTWTWLQRSSPPCFCPEAVFEILHG